MVTTEADHKNDPIDQQEDCWLTILWWLVQCLCSEPEDKGKGD